ncbi:hypothetical protein ASG68_11950 [Rhizobium sp. Leaf453]|nr:hypothetical protein ASG68_11950 [Rhizobium sp. Leaf453]
MIAAYRRLADDLEQFAMRGLKSISSSATITDWVIAKRAVPVLLGTIAGHPHIKTGNAGFTTEIVFWDQNQNVARTFNRWYRLGRPLDGGPNQ